VTTDLNPNDFFDAIDRALADPEPLALLMMASTVIAALEGRSTRQPQAKMDESELAKFCDTLLSEGSSQTAALARVIGDMAGDDAMREKVRRTLVERRANLPGWVKNLHNARVEGALEMIDVLGDGQNVVVAVQLPNGHGVNAVVYIDHNVGTLVKDAFVVAGGLSEMRDAWMAAYQADPTMAVGSSLVLEPSQADARARIESAIEHGRQTDSPYETNTWPACEPLVEWAVRMMPPGGTSFVRPIFTDAQIDALTDEFFDSSFGIEFRDNDDNWFVVDSLMDFGLQSAVGDPLRWSAVAVELVLVDWIPRVVSAPRQTLSRTPDVLRAFIRHSHAARGIPHALTVQTVDAVAQWETQFFDLLDQRPDFTAGVGMTELQYHVLELHALSVSVGLPAILEPVSAVPLPDEEFNWSRLPDSIRTKTTDVLRLVDACADALFDTEFRTACRRFLARVVAEDPGLIGGRAAVASIAAAVVWSINRANNDLARDQPRVTAKDITAYLGVKSTPGPRAEMMRQALGIYDPGFDYGLQSADYLTSSTRVAVEQMRGVHRRAIAELTIAQSQQA
jgi:hypothetical protein